MKNALIVTFVFALLLGGFLFLFSQGPSSGEPEVIVFEEEETETAVEEAQQSGTVVFRGIFIDSSGSEVETTVSLMSTGERGGEFVLTETNGDESDSFSVSGQWETRLDILENSLVYELLLDEEGESVQYFELVDPTRLRALTEEGERIEDESALELVRIDA